MINKELLSEVMGFKAYPIKNKHILWDTNKRENDLVYEKTNELQYCINIYELAHKCKEWANKQGILLRSSIDGVVDFYDFRINGEDKGEFIDCREFKCSEVEAVIQACQWILDNVKTDSLS